MNKEHYLLLHTYKNSMNYKKYDKFVGSMFNSWRSKVYTAKGKKIGFPENWKTFESFENDMSQGWEKNKILIRLDTSLPYSKENCIWADKGQESLNRCLKLTHNGVTKYLFEWCLEYNLYLNGATIRYHKHKNYTSEQILFGKLSTRKRKVIDISELQNEQKKKDKISKMLSAYRIRDKKRNRDNDITIEYLTNALKNSCIYCGSNEKIGLDRIDNSKGHLMNNCVSCCYRCNTTRQNNFTYDEMLILGRTIKKIDNAKNK